MNVKELKEFLKDIDDDVEIFTYQEKYIEEYKGKCMCCYDKFNSDDIYFDGNTKTLFL